MDSPLRKLAQRFARGIPSVARAQLPKGKRAWARALGTAMIACAVLPPCALFAASLWVSVPPALVERGPHGRSTRYLDRNGFQLREVRASDGKRAGYTKLDELGEYLPQAMVAAEDKRFRDHSGVDGWAVLRAVVLDLRRGRAASGASTLTMQLARVEAPHPRTLRGKFLEAATALKIERTLSKDEILEAYLNDAPFGPTTAGAGRAAEILFDKAAKELSLAEAATLASLPRGPAFYDLAKHPERVVARRNVILHRMRECGFVDDAHLSAALAEPLTPRFTQGGFGAPHFIEGLRSGALDSLLPVPRADAKKPVLSDALQVRTTIDKTVQQQAETLTERVVGRLADRHVQSASVIVVENATGEVLAWVGSPDWSDDGALGKNDGVTALRQPGSTLKPFVYELGMERWHQSPATLLFDVDTAFRGATGAVFRPGNYDGRFHGAVRLREALANSWNVPAAREAHELGVGSVLDRLRALGFASLTEDADHYGEALALGDGETRLFELARAYTALARGGDVVPLRLVRGIATVNGNVEFPIIAPDPPVLKSEDVALITGILQDDHARLAAFGRNADLGAFPFPVAVKTGTSKGFRDNLTVGYSDRVTVAVWVGNFGGEPMGGTTGVSGAAPLFHGVMLAAHGRAAAAPAAPSNSVDGSGISIAKDSDIQSVELCALSGKLPEPQCAHRIRELLPASRVPHDACTMHKRVRIDRSNGLLAGPGCSLNDVDDRTFEVYPAEALSWAEAVHRPLLPRESSPRCPLPLNTDGFGEGAEFTSPRPEARFVIDHDRPLRFQRIPVRLSHGSLTQGVLRLDGVVVKGDDVPMTVGVHELRFEQKDGKPLLSSRFTVIE